jgi:hypothetical protein
MHALVVTECTIHSGTRGRSFVRLREAVKHAGCCL